MIWRRHIIVHVRQSTAAFALAASLLLLSVICPCLVAAADTPRQTSHDCGSAPVPERETSASDCELTCARDAGVEAHRVGHLPVSADESIAAPPQHPTFGLVADSNTHRLPLIKPPGPDRSLSILYSVLIA